MNLQLEPSNPKTQNEQVSPREAAGILGCCYETVLRYVADGRLPAVRPLGQGRGRQIVIERAAVLRFREALQVVTGRQIPAA